MSTPPDPYLTTRQAAELLGVSPASIIRWILHDGLTARRVRCRGGQYRYQVLRSVCLARLETVRARRVKVAAAVALPLDPYTRDVLQRHGLLRYYRGAQ